MEIRIGLLGLGTVGSGVYQLLHDHAAHIAEQCGATPVVSKVLVRDSARARTVSNGTGITTQAADVLDDPDIQVVVELMGGLDPAGRYIETALARGKHVVSANKELLARQGPALLAQAQDKSLALLFEASVAGGIPIIRALRESLCGDEIDTLQGIVNGTTNYILTRMTRERLPFDDALREAQAKGYAEADPGNDIYGVDAMYKLALLVSMAFGTPVDVSTLSHRGIDQVHLNDIEYARDLGLTVKLLAEAHRADGVIYAGVQPCMLAVTHPLASVMNNFNAVLVHGQYAGDLMFYGQGAGARPTATAVVSDIVDVCRGLASGTTVAATGGYWRHAAQTVRPLADRADRYYLRLRLPDRPGVLASVAHIFGDEQVSFLSVLQKSHGEDPVDVVFLTHEALGGAVQAAVEKVRSLPQHDVAAVYRVI